MIPLPALASVSMYSQTSSFPLAPIRRVAHAPLVWWAAPTPLASLIRSYSSTTKPLQLAAVHGVLVELVHRVLLLPVRAALGLVEPVRDQGLQHHPRLLPPRLHCRDLASGESEALDEKGLRADHAAGDEELVRAAALTGPAQELVLVARGEGGRGQAWDEGEEDGEEDGEHGRSHIEKR